MGTFPVLDSEANLEISDFIMVRHLNVLFILEHWCDRMMMSEHANKGDGYNKPKSRGGSVNIVTGWTRRPEFDCRKGRNFCLRLCFKLSFGSKVLSSQLV
jgi:hypothetical protein